MSQPTEEELSNMSPEEVAELQKKNCLFCKIISGDIPSKKVYEDKDFLGVLDIYPAKEGHVVLMPKKHLQVMPQMPPDMVAGFGIACKKISMKILGAFNAKGTSVFIANGLHAGQKAPHFMAHIIPRDDGDSVNLNPRMEEIPPAEFEGLKAALTGASGKPRSKEMPRRDMEENASSKISKGKEGKPDLDAISRLFE